jgi:hypothetical protein
MRCKAFTTPAFGGADGDGDGIVDSNDYDIWRSNFGTGGAAGATVPAQVPEPATCSLFAAVIGYVSLERLRKRHA